MTDKPTRGGSRAGAGRKPDPNAKVSTTIRLSRDIKEYLATTDDATATIETTIRNSRGYKQWKRQ